MFMVKKTDKQPFKAVDRAKAKECFNTGWGCVYGFEFPFLEG